MIAQAGTILVGSPSVDLRELNVSKKQAVESSPPIDDAESKALGKTVSARLRPRVMRAFLRYVAQSMPRVQKAAVVEAAIEKFLREEGFLDDETGDDE